MVEGYWKPYENNGMFTSVFKWWFGVRNHPQYVHGFVQSLEVELKVKFPTFTWLQSHTFSRSFGKFPETQPSLACFPLTMSVGCHWFHFRYWFGMVWGDLSPRLPSCWTYNLFRASAIFVRFESSEIWIPLEFGLFIFRQTQISRFNWSVKSPFWQMVQSCSIPFFSDKANPRKSHPEITLSVFSFPQSVGFTAGCWQKTPFQAG